MRSSCVARIPEAGKPSLLLNKPGRLRRRPEPSNIYALEQMSDRLARIDGLQLCASDPLQLLTCLFPGLYPASKQIRISVAVELHRFNRSARKNDADILDV